METKETLEETVARIAEERKGKAPHGDGLRRYRARLKAEGKKPRGRINDMMRGDRTVECLEGYQKGLTIAEIAEKTNLTQQQVNTALAGIPKYVRLKHGDKITELTQKVLTRLEDALIKVESKQGTADEIQAWLACQREWRETIQAICKLLGLNKEKPSPEPSNGGGVSIIINVASDSAKVLTQQILAGQLPTEAGD